MKMSGLKKFLIGAGIAFAVGAVVAVVNEPDEKSSNDVKPVASSEKTESKDSPKEEVKPIDSTPFELSNGNYIAGEDFDAGTYDIVAISGSGTVSSSNMFDGGIHAMMSGKQSEYYEKEYKNISLPKGTTLKIDGVTIELTRKK